jgi:tetratricopeptide (TPR) repeat protein
MKLIEGRPLDELVRAAKTLDDRLALFPHVIAVTDAIAYAHDHRVIHRDLKPSNVIAGEYGETVVIDWGLAKDLGDEEGETAATGMASGTDSGVGSTMAGAVLGTPAYMPPEQAEGAALDERADVYALGAILYHVLCGQPPYTGTSGKQILERVKAGPPDSLAARQAGVPRDLLAVVDKAMARAPGARYENAKQLAEDLRRFERGQLVAAHAYSRRELVKRWLLKHRAMVAVATAALVGVAIASTLWLRAEMRERAAGERRIAELLHADDTDHATALAQLRTSAFDGAAATLAREVEHLAGKREAALVARHREREVEHARAQRIADFYRHAKLAIFLVGDEDRGPEAIVELTTALGALDAFEPGGRMRTTPWWDGLFPGELTPDQRLDMQREAYRLVLNLAFLHFKQGAIGPQTGDRDPAEAAKHFRTALEVLAQTTPLERALGLVPARVTRVWQAMTLRFYSMVGSEQELAAAGAGPLAPVPAGAAGRENPDDYHLLGVGHFVVWQNQGTSFGSGLRMMFPDAFDYAQPLERAERDLRTAIRLDPTLYWAHFMLGMTLRSRGDFGGSELAFGTCIMLEPDFMIGYGQRAATLAQRALREIESARRDELMARAIADSDITVAREPDLPATHWTRGDLLRTLGRRDDAIDAYIRALELDENVQGKFSRQIAIRDIKTYVLTELTDADVDARVLLAMMSLASGDAADARALADEALRLAPNDARALGLRARMGTSP